MSSQSQFQLLQHQLPGQSNTIISMVALPRVIEACAAVSAKTDESIGAMRNICLEETGKCIAAVQQLEAGVLKRNDIEILKADLDAVGDKLDNVKKDVSALQTSLETFKSEVLSILQSFGQSVQPTLCDNAHREFEEQGSSNGNVLFLSVKHDGVDQNLYLTRCSRDTLLGCRKKREAIRRVLLHFNSIKELRQFSLTGESSGANGKGQLPPLHAKFAEAAVLKLFPPNPKLKEIINDDGSTKYDDDIKALKSEVRTKITSILEYYFKRYGHDGTKIPERLSRKRKIPSDEDLSQSVIT